jgi:hypothetical protein
MNPVKEVTTQLCLLNKANYCCWSSYHISYFFLVFPECKNFVILIKFQGTSYFENLLEVLEQTYKFKLETFLSAKNVPTKGLGFAGLALISAQKIFLFLGDLARYKEQVNETSNFGKSRQCYIKAHQINPKNGRPYNQLAILAVYAVSMMNFVIAIIVYKSQNISVAVVSDYRLGR